MCPRTFCEGLLTIVITKKCRFVCICIQNQHYFCWTKRMFLIWIFASAARCYSAAFLSRFLGMPISIQYIQNIVLCCYSIYEDYMYICNIVCRMTRPLSVWSISSFHIVLIEAVANGGRLLIPSHQPFLHHFCFAHDVVFLPGASLEYFCIHLAYM